jgi:hypothetical protein
MLQVEASNAGLNFIVVAFIITNVHNLADNLKSMCAATLHQECRSFEISNSLQL